MTNTAKAVTTAKQIGDKVSHLHTLFSGVKSFFKVNTGADATPSKEGMQAAKSGKGPVDESNFLEALALAGEELFSEAQYTNRDAVNDMEDKVVIVIGSYSPPRREDIILYLGLGEKPVTKNIFSGKYDKNGKKIFDQIKTIRNERGINILKTWMLKTPDQIHNIIRSTVGTGEYRIYRFQQVIDYAERYVTAMEKRHSKLPERKSLEELRAENGTNPFSTLWKSLSRRKK